MVAGGAESCIHPLAIGGFARLRSLATGFNDFPQKASRPFDAHRQGFVVGEGAAVVILEVNTLLLCQMTLARPTDCWDLEGIGTCQSPGGSHLRRITRLWLFRGCAPPYGPEEKRYWRLDGHEKGVEECPSRMLPLQ
jgi:Beta-ketoacyl synthase, N-terminal domain